MPIQFIRPGFLGEIRDPFDCDEQAVKALAGRCETKAERCGGDRLL